MKAAVTTGEMRKLVVEEVPTPVVEPGKLLLKVNCCSICGTDLEYLDNSLAYRPGGELKPGAIVGHEYCAEVVEVGEGVDGWSVGDRGMRIIAVDIAADKLGLARQLGATDTFDATEPDCIDNIIEATQGGVEYAFEVAGAVEAMRTAYAITRRGGTTVTSGLSHHQHSFDVPHAQLVVDERTIKGSYMGSSVVRQDVPKFISLYKQGKLPVDRLRSGNIGLEDLNRGFDKLAAGDAVRQMLVMHPEFGA